MCYSIILWHFNDLTLTSWNCNLNHYETPRALVEVQRLKTAAWQLLTRGSKIKNLKNSHKLYTLALIIKKSSYTVDFKHDLSTCFVQNNVERKEIKEETLCSVYKMAPHTKVIWNGLVFCTTFDGDQYHFFEENKFWKLAVN